MITQKIKSVQAYSHACIKHEQQKILHHQNIYKFDIRNFETGKSYS